MANDRHYVPGDNYLLDDLSGFKIRSSRARMIPGGQTGGLYVDPARWEPEQPQDFVTGAYDDQTVAISRPRQVNQFIIVGTFVTQRSARGLYIILVDSTQGFLVGMTILVMLDTGVNFIVTVLAINGNFMTLAAPLPASVGSLDAAPIENAVIAYNAVGQVPGYGLADDGGALQVVDGTGWPTSPSGLAGGAFWDNGGLACIVDGGTPDAFFPSVFYGTVSSLSLLAMNGADFPTSYIGLLTGSFWNNGGVVSIVGG